MDENADTRLFESAAARRRTLARAALVAFALALATLVAVLAVPDLAWVRSRLAALGPLAPAAFVALQAVQVLVAPVPGQVLGGVAGGLFGTLPGAAYSLLGVLVGSTAAFWAARRYGRSFLESVLAPGALETWDGVLDGGGAVGLFVLFVLPVFPDDLLCFVAGVSTIRFRTFIVLVALGRAPSFLVAAYAGNGVAEGALLAAGSALAALAVVSAVVARERERIVALVEGP